MVSQPATGLGREQGWCLLGLPWKAWCQDVILLSKKIQQQNPSGFGGRGMFRHPPASLLFLNTVCTQILCQEVGIKLKCGAKPLEWMRFEWRIPTGDWRSG